MKLKIFIKLLEKLMGKKSKNGEDMPDMYLPDRLLAMSVVFVALGVGIAFWAFLSHKTWGFALAPVGVLLGFFAFLCWKNQSIRMISNEQFTYTTMFGKTSTHNFSDIRGLIKNKDSYTLWVGDRKIHIESMALMSRRLVDRINKELERLRNENN